MRKGNFSLESFISAPTNVYQEAKTLWSFVRKEPVRALMMFIYFTSGSLKVMAPQPIQAAFQYGHPLWLYRTSGLMEFGVVKGLIRQEPKQVSALSYTFLGGVLYTITVFPQDLPAFLVKSPLLKAVARSATFVPPLATVALTAYYQRHIAGDGEVWNISDWRRKVIQPMVLGIVMGACGGHVFSIKAKG